VRHRVAGIDCEQRQRYDEQGNPETPWQVAMCARAANRCLQPNPSAPALDVACWGQSLAS
jgi:hypothetical protein